MAKKEKEMPKEQIITLFDKEYKEDDAKSALLTNAKAKYAELNG